MTQVSSRMPNRCRCFFMSIFFWIGEYYCCLVVVCRAGVRGVASQLCVPCGLSVGGRLTLQRYCAAHGLVNGFGGCCANLRGFCANHRFCGGQSRCPVQGRAYASYQCPLRASRVLQRKMRVRTWPSRWLPPVPAIFIAAVRGYSSSSTSKALNFLKSITHLLSAF